MIAQIILLATGMTFIAYAGKLNIPVKKIQPKSTIKYAAHPPRPIQANQPLPKPKKKK